MNIEIANRLVNLRKRNNLSQEALAAKLGISRQAVSKWERAEASPDTDNLILLARLYKISLDELLLTEDEIPEPEEEPLMEAQSNGPVQAAGKEPLVLEAGEMRKEEPVLEARGMEKEETGQAGKPTGKGDAERSAEEAPPGAAGEGAVSSAYCSQGDYREPEGASDFAGYEGKYEIPEDILEEYEAHGEERYYPIPVVILICYLLIGVLFNAWHPGWLVFLLVPIWYSLTVAVENRNAYCFAYPVLAALIYLCLGIFLNAWHPGWIIFLTIPLYYPTVSWLKRRTRRRAFKEGYKDGWNR